MPKTYDLERFKKAQARDYARALQEIKNGRKRSHWIWYIFPQLKTLGYSANAQYYGIANLAEAKAYLQDPLLRQRLIDITQALLQHAGQSPEVILGGIDAMKVRSCMTLFLAADPELTLFQEVLDVFYDGIPDAQTYAYLKTQS